MKNKIFILFAVCFLTLLAPQSPANTIANLNTALKQVKAKLSNLSTKLTDLKESEKVEVTNLNAALNILIEKKILDEDDLSYLKNETKLTIYPAYKLGKLEDKNFSIQLAQALTTILSEYNKLKKIVISNLEITDDALKIILQALAKNTTITSLEISYLKLKADLLATTIKKLPKSLQKLDIGGSNLKDADLSEFQFPTSLTHLNMSSSDLNETDLSKLVLPHSLQELKLNTNFLRKENLSEFLKIKIPPSLTSLDLSYNFFDEDGMSKLLNHSIAKRLKVLNLEGIQLDFGLSLGYSWPKLEKLESLEELNLQINIKYNMTDLSILRLPPTLISLDLSNNNLGKNDLSKLSLPQQLMTLNLSNNNLDIDNIKKLKLPTTLNKLDLSDNSISAYPDQLGHLKHSSKESFKDVYKKE